MNHQEICHRIMSNKFNKSLKRDCFYYEKGSEKYIVLYHWQDGFAYRAGFKCLPNKIGFEEACSYIENRFKIKEKRKEYMMFADTLIKRETNDLEIRELRLEEEILLEQLKEACDIAEVEVAQLSIHDIHPLGGFVDGKLVAASSILSLWGAYDIGVITHPHHRQKGYSRALAYANAVWATQEGYPSMYRCDEDNIASYRCGLSLGYKEDVIIVVYELEK